MVVNGVKPVELSKLVDRLEPVETVDAAVAAPAKPKADRQSKPKADKPAAKPAAKAKADNQAPKEGKGAAMIADLKGVGYRRPSYWNSPAGQG
jgi:hypothetical protein